MKDAETERLLNYVVNEIGRITKEIDSLKNKILSFEQN